MITLYESSRLIYLIARKNDYKELVGNSFTYNGNEICISLSNYKYTNLDLKIDIFPRLQKKNSLNQKFEIYLQMYITQNLGCAVNKSLDIALDISNSDLEWLGNEVSCGVGMQKIDIMFSKKISEAEHLLVPIELKALEVEECNITQIERYIEWIYQYYIPNTPSIIQPTLICKKGKSLSDYLKHNFNEFNKTNSQKGVLPLKYIEYEIDDKNIFFEKVEY